MNVCCLNCGQYFGYLDSGGDFCCDDCEEKFRIYLEEEIQKEKIIESTGRCLNCGNLVYVSDKFCNDDCETELIKNLEYEEALE